MGKNELEKHILSRSYSSEARVLELLTSRYSASGEQRPLLILTPTGGALRGSDRATSLLHTEKKTVQDLDKDFKLRKCHIRANLRRYISKTLKSQKQLASKLRKKLFSESTIQQLIDRHDIPIFEDFLSMNSLWQQYMTDLLFRDPNVSKKDQLKPPTIITKQPPPISQPQSHHKITDTPQVPTMKLPSITQLLPKLSSADYSGCLLTVIKAKNNQLVGTRGIVVWDTQHLFIICVPRGTDARKWLEDSSVSPSPTQMVGGLRVIPKKGAIFAFEVNVDEESCIGFTIVGSRFEFRNVERAARKFKNHAVDDI